MKPDILVASSTPLSYHQETTIWRIHLARRVRTQKLFSVRHWFNYHLTKRQVWKLHLVTAGMPHIIVPSLIPLSYLTIWHVWGIHLARVRSRNTCYGIGSTTISRQVTHSKPRLNLLPSYFASWHEPFLKLDTKCPYNLKNTSLEPKKAIHTTNTQRSCLTDEPYNIPKETRFMPIAIDVPKGKRIARVRPHILVASAIPLPLSQQLTRFTICINSTEPKCLFEQLVVNRLKNGTCCYIAMRQDQVKTIEDRDDW